MRYRAGALTLAGALSITLAEAVAAVTVDTFPVPDGAHPHDVAPQPGEDARAYAVYVDHRDDIWVSDFGANAVLRFDPATARFESFPGSGPNASVRQILGREGEVWAPESGRDTLVRFRLE